MAAQDSSADTLLDFLQANGIKGLTVQIGNGNFEPENLIAAGKKKSFPVEVFRLKPSILPYIEVFYVCRDFSARTITSLFFACVSSHQCKISFCPPHNLETQGSSLVISHAGAGSILETLRCPRNTGSQARRLIVVVNEKLMDNHQQELADAMADEGYLLKAVPSTLISVLKNCFEPTLKPFPAIDRNAFSDMVGEHMASVSSAR